MHLRCPHCQNPIEIADAPSGAEITCAGCGSSFAIASTSTASWPKQESKRIGKFEVLGVVGQGAFGTVVKAHDTELDRVVAIKIPRAGNVGSGQDDVDRFLREARAVAQLHFPSIIAIHEVGLDDGAPYLVCDFVEGVTLADLLTSRRLAFRESAQLLAAVADALQYAHSLGVIHRDIKPSNIMIRTDGSPCVMDFGLAKRDAGEITMTMDGQILGTPAYMSPEQARGESHKVDGRSDVYSLGVILYQLLTNGLPFRGNKAMLLHQVLHDEPKAPRSLNDRIPRDLETIALKAMAKEPQRRYASAKELAEDLRRWLAEEPILARPVGTVERLWRWCRRKPALATANAAVFVAMVTFAAAFLMVNASLENEADARKKAEKLADDNRLLAVKETTARLAADERREQAEELALQVSFNSFHMRSTAYPALAFVGAAQLLPQAVKLKDRRLLDSMRLHLGGWAPEMHQLHWIGSHEGEVGQVVISTDGKLALTGSYDKTAQLWEVATGKPIGPSLKHDGIVHAVALSADGKIILTGSDEKTARLWEAASGKQIRVLHHQDAIRAVALSPDGKIALTGSWDKTARLWKTATGEPIGLPLQHQDQVWYAVLSSDGKIAATAGWDCTARFWHAETGKPLGPPVLHPKRILSLALSCDGKIALTACEDYMARLWETRTGKQIGLPLEHKNWILTTLFNADDKIVFTGSHDKTVRRWDAATGKPIGPPLQHPNAVLAMALSADGKTLLTGSIDTTARMWDVVNAKPIGAPLPHHGWVVAVALSPDGKTALTGSLDNNARLWRVGAGKPSRVLQQNQGKVSTVALSGDGKIALTASGNSARLWDTAIGNSIRTFPHKAEVLAVALSRDGTIALTGCADGNAYLWNPATDNSIGPPLRHQSPVLAATLSADGKTALTGSRDRMSRSWRTADGSPIGKPLEHSNQVWSLALSADGKIALAGSFMGAQIWEIATGKLIGPPLPHQGWVTSAGLSADAKFALTGCLDRSARLWETATGKPIGPPLQHQDFVWAAALSADGKIALTGSADGVAMLWETTTGKLVGLPMLHQNRVTAAALSADGKIALTGSDDQTAKIWKAASKLNGDPERLMLWTQVITGTEADEYGNARALEAVEWHKRRERLQQLGGSPPLD